MDKKKKFYRTMIRWLWLFPLGLSISSLLSASSFAAGKNKIDRISAQSALLSNLKGGQPLFSKNTDRRVHPASTTKVMTALLVLEHLSLNAIVSVPSTAVNVAPSKIDLASGEQ